MVDVDAVVAVLVLPTNKSEVWVRGNQGPVLYQTPRQLGCCRACECRRKKHSLIHEDVLLTLRKGSNFQSSNVT